MEVNFMQTQVKAWGNSQGIRLPKDILQAVSYTHLTLPTT